MFWINTVLAQLTVSLLDVLVLTILFAAIGVKHTTFYVASAACVLAINCCLQIRLLRGEQWAISHDEVHFDDHMRDVVFRVKPSISALIRYSLLAFCVFLLGMTLSPYIGNIALAPSLILFLFCVLTMRRLLGDQIRLQTAAHLLDLSPHKVRAKYKEFQSEALLHSHTFRYDHYCAVVNGTCQKSLVHHGKLSCFIAYPFGGPIEERVREMANCFQKAGFAAVRATDSMQDNILVCKLCKLILSCQAFIAELTVPNRNVFFEYGYAKAIGKPTWVLVHNRSPNNPLVHGFLGDKIHLTYDNPLDVARRIISEFDYRLTPADDERRLQSTQDGNEGTQVVSVLSPVMLSQWDTRMHGATSQIMPIIDEIIDVLADLRVEHEIIDRMGGHQILAFSANLRRSSLVLGVLASDQCEDSEVYNSAVSYLIGLAIASRKKVLLLQQMPNRKPMLDLLGITKPLYSVSGTYSMVVDVLAAYCIPVNP